MKHRDSEQFHKAEAAPNLTETGGDTFDLEAILREFGSGTPETPAGPEPAASGETETVKEYVPGKKKPPAPSRPSGLSGDTVAFRPLGSGTPGPEVLRAPMKVAGPPGTPPVLYQEEPPVPPAAPPAPAPPVQQVPSKEAPAPGKTACKGRRPEKKAPAGPVPVPRAPTPQERFDALLRPMSSMQVRRTILALLVLPQVFLLLYEAFSWTFLPLSPRILSYLSMGLLGLSMVLTPEVLLRGFQDLFRGRPDCNLPGALAAVVAIADSALTGTAGYCGLAAVLWFSLYRGIVCRRSGLLHTLRTVCSFDRPVGIYTAPGLLKQGDSLRRDKANVRDFMFRLEGRDGPGLVMLVYSLMILLLTPVLSYFLSRIREVTFLRCWLLLLLGSLPLYSGLCYSKPLATLSRRLRRAGGALCGWYSTRIFRGRHTLILRDADLFPPRHIVSSGMKLYSAENPSKIIAYALAALRAADNPLADLFEGLLENQYGRHFTADDYRCYDTGGIGAQLGPDVVLVGSLAFMRSMGIPLPEGTRVRQAAYVSLNGELAGIFAFKYKPSASTRTGLLDVLSKRNIRVVLATRDFLISPELLAARYDIPTESLSFPPYSERLRLSQADAGEGTAQGALISGSTFGAFASTVASGQLLRSGGRLSSVLCVLAGLMGLGLCALLILWNSPGTASPLHLGIFQALWGILTSFVTFIVLRP